MARGRRRKLLAELLIGIEQRGRDASGVAWRTPDGTVWIQKDAVPARVLARSVDTSGEWQTAIAHARWATKGTPKENGNNHPVQVDSYIGVHNGVAYNDDEIFDLLADHDVTRQHQVDTEAIFALMRYGVRAFPEYDGQRSDLLSLVEGSAALAWMLREDQADTLYLARASGSPLYIGHTPGRSLVFASTRAILVTACDRAGVELRKITEVSEGTALKVRGGRVRTVSRFFSAGGRKPHSTATYQGASAFEAKPPAVKPRGRAHVRTAAANSAFDRLAPEPRFHSDRTVDGWPAWDGDEVIGWTDTDDREFAMWESGNKQYLADLDGGFSPSSWEGEFDGRFPTG